MIETSQWRMKSETAAAYRNSILERCCCVGWFAFIVYHGRKVFFNVFARLREKFDEYRTARGRSFV